MTHISASLEIRNFSCNPEMISALLDIAPTESWRVGDRMKATQAVRRHSGWRLRSGSTENVELEPHLLWLLDRLPATVDFGSLTEHWDILFRFEVHFAEQMPAIYFSKMSLRRLVTLGGELDIDLYHTSDATL